MSKNGNLLESTVAKYNTVAVLSSAPVTQIDSTNVSSGIFAWQAGPGMMLFSYYLFSLLLLCKINLFWNFCWGVEFHNMKIISQP